MIKPIAWTIAGSDSSNGAGMHADLKTFHALGTHGCAITTAITAQNNNEVSSIHFMKPEFIAEQITALEQSFPAKAIKVGMLGQADLISFLKNFSGKVVLDPVMVSSSGYELTQNFQQYLNHLKKLFTFIDVLTPNLQEASVLTNFKINSYDDIKVAAQKILSLGVKSVLIKGGHISDSNFSQDYWTNGAESFWLAAKRQSNQNFRGTGCVFASAITACLALGYEIKDAVVIAKMYINQSMRHAYTINHAAHLNHLNWPELQNDLPYLTNQPILIEPENFPICNQIGLYPVVDNIEWLKKLLPLGITTIQLRIKNKTANELENIIRDAVIIANQYTARLFINDYWELAIKHNAYGVHLGQEDLTSADMQKIHAAGLRLGISTHCYYEVARAHSFKPSYIAYGPIYATTSKIMPFQPQGILQLARWRRTLDYPLVAIGGINLQRMPDVINTGVEGVAMISAITQAENYVDITKKLIRYT